MAACDCGRRPSTLRLNPFWPCIYFFKWRWCPVSRWPVTSAASNGQNHFHVCPVSWASVSGIRCGHLQWTPANGRNSKVRCSTFPSDNKMRKLCCLCTPDRMNTGNAKVFFPPRSTTRSFLPHPLQAPVDIPLTNLGYKVSLKKSTYMLQTSTG